MGLVITDPYKQDSEALFLKWNFFANYNPETLLSLEDRAVPLSLPGRSSYSKYIFFLGATDYQGWLPESRTYSFRLVAWSKENLTPNLLTEYKVTFSDVECNALRELIINKRGLIIWVDRDEWGKWQPKKLSMSEIEAIRSLNP